MESLERLQGLHADLIAVTQRSIFNIDRLQQELQESISDFRTLLDKTKSTEEEAKAYREGTLDVGGQQFSINEGFRHLSNAIGTALSISEEYAGRLLIETQAAGIEDEQAVIADVVRKYHDRRDYLLQDLRLILEQAVDEDSEEHERSAFQNVVSDILDSGNGSIGNGAQYTQKCLQNMQDIEEWQNKLDNDIQSKALLGQARGEAFYRTLEFQRSSLFKQHEALGAILALLFRGAHATSENLRKLHAASLKWQKLDFNWIHYLPAFSIAFRRHGAADGHGTPQDAQALNQTFISATPDAANGPYRPLAATLEMWWTAQYSGHYRDSAALDPNASKRTKIMDKALEDGCLEFMLSICTHMKNDPWQRLSRQELVDMLLDGSNISFEGVEPTSSFFATMMMESFERFAEAWITNMPDSIRKLKTDEDDRRLLQITASVDGLMQRPARHQGVRLYLESFLVIMAFAFENRPDAAEQFWEDLEGNFYGFLQWASRRQTVPRVSAFCELLCSISTLSDNAQAAHKFLLEDTVPVPNTRSKRLPSMNYQQIFLEIDFYSKKVHEKVQMAQGAKTRQNSEPELNEAESPIMLSWYLRLLGHLFRQTALTRNYVITLPDFDLSKCLLALSSGPIPSFLRASIFLFFEALLTDKDVSISHRVWTLIEEWAATNHDRAGAVPGDKPVVATLSALQSTLTAVQTSYDQYDAFVKLLLALVAPVPGTSGLPLPFPSELGTTYRTPGIVPYVDFVCGQLTTNNLRSWFEDGNLNGVVRSIDCVSFMSSCLKGFNESYVTTPDRASLGAGNDETYAAMYAQRHPFARIMQWAFSINLNKCLMDLLHLPSDTVEAAALDDPKIVNLVRTVELLNCIILLSPTYFDIVKPKTKTADGYKVIQFSGAAAIEDSVIARPESLLDLCHYAASDHVQLSLESLVFLQKLAESAKFQYHLFEDAQGGRQGRQMIEMLGPTGEAQLKHVSAILARHLMISDRELEAGCESEGYLLKEGVLAFLNACLATQSESPNIAHLLLGFERVGSRLGLTAEFDQGDSIFDALANLSSNFPDAYEGSVQSWLAHIKAESIGVLKHLWSFPVSRDLTMIQLRRASFLAHQFGSQTTVAQQTLWDGKSIIEPSFYFHTSAEAFTSFLSYRTHLYNYAKQEIQDVAKSNIRALQDKYAVMLQGRSADSDGTVVSHPSVLDLFDFAELDTKPPPSLGPPDLDFFSIDFDAYQKDQLYQVDKVQTVLDRQCSYIIQQFAAVNKQVDENAMHDEANYVIGLLEARNRCILAQSERLICLRSYVDMIISVVDCCPMEPATKTQFILHMLQLILPKLDTCLSDGVAEAVELTRMADTLLFALSTTEAATQGAQTRVDITVAEKLFQLFRICAEGVLLSTSTPDLRAVLYSICSGYLTRILSSPASTASSSQKARTNAMDTVRSAGPQLISILSDDADDGLDTCRLNALNLLSQLVNLSRNENSNLIIESFVKSNILEVLLDPIKNVAEEFQATEPSNRPILLTLFESRALLLLQVSRTRPGATALLSASFTQTLRNSNLFATDPDLGFDPSPINPAGLIRSTNMTRSTTNGGLGGHIKTALVTYFKLLSSCLRLLLSTFLTFGPENEKIIYLVRSFLAEYRGNMVGIFKRAAGLNLSAQQGQQSLFGEGAMAGKDERELSKLVDECAIAYTGLAVGSGFLEYENESGLTGNDVVTGTPTMRSYNNGGGFT